MMNYRFWNNLLAWVTFLVAFFTYFSTMEPTTSFWDCGEFIACSYKLQVGHPPGAPLFLMLGRFFSLFASDVTEVAYWINMVSVLASAFTIAFLFWTITLLAKKIATKAMGIESADDMPLGVRVAILGSGFIGALTYTFTDTFWFSAVEAEVYATSSLFTALVFWAMLRWDEDADKPHADRWLVLIAYLMGLSIGVHLLNLLTIPALAFIYYFRRYKPTPAGVLGTLFIGGFFLLFVQYGIIPGLVEGAAEFEWMFTNWFGLPFLSGSIFYLILLLLFITLGLRLTSQNKASMGLYLAATAIFWAVFFASISVWMSIVGVGLFLICWAITKDKFFAFLLAVTGVLPGLLLWYGIYKDKENDKFAGKGWHSANSTMNLMISFFTVILMGYLSYALIIIRSNANTPMDENNPADMYSLLSYLNREQYGSQPLFYGPYYYAVPKEYADKGPIVTRAYIVLDKGKQVTYFTEKIEAEAFVKNANEKEGKNYSLGYKYLETDRKKEPVYPGNESTIFPRMWSPQGHHVREYKYWGSVKGNSKPTFGNNLTFFFSYHIRHMYNRYFLWNFVGRQNDIQGNGEPINGNWISGIRPLDAFITGAPQKNLSEERAANHGRNAYYFIPLLLGIVGFFYHLRSNGRNFIIVFMLFFLTGYAIVLYLNQTPLQPRERDYAYAGSFYAFCIWIGLGVYAIYDLLDRALKGAIPKVALAAFASIITLGIPALLAFQNYDDHNRAKRYTARDFAFNYLNSCAKNAVIFTNGDNDTFPLWYAQEVEDVRTDVRVVNLSLLNTDWYIDQMKRAAYDGPGVPFGMRQDHYLGTKRDQVLFDSENPKFYTIQEHFDWLLNSPKNQIDVGRGQKLYYFRSNKFIIPIDSAKVVANGTVPKGMEGRVAKEIRLVIDKQYVLKSDLMILSLLNNFNWDRPIYFAITVGEDFMGLQDYFQLEGMAYRLVPYKARSHDRQPGEVNSDIMYENLMTKFVWGNMPDSSVYLDETNMRMTFNFRNSFMRLASKLYLEGKHKKAIEVLDKSEELMPDRRIPYNYFNLLMADLYIDLKQFDKAENMLNRLEQRTQEELTYFGQFTGKSAKSIEEDSRRSGAIMQSVSDLKLKLQAAKLNPSALKGPNELQLEEQIPDSVPAAVPDSSRP